MYCEFCVFEDVVIVGLFGVVVCIVGMLNGVDEFFIWF